MIKKCGIILYDIQNKKYFLVKGKKSNKWGFPKGHMEEGETIEETAHREFYEETGFRLNQNLDNLPRYTIRNNIYFIVTIHDEQDMIQETDKIPDTNEIEKYQWTSINELLSYDLNKCNFGLKTWILKNCFFKLIKACISFPNVLLQLFSNQI